MRRSGNESQRILLLNQLSHVTNGLQAAIERKIG